MNKFSQSEYTKEAVSNLIKKLHIADEYPYEILADYSGLSTSMIRQIADGNREMKSQYFVNMARKLLDRDGNARALNLILPPNYSAVEIGEVQSNGCPKDEFIDGSDALHKFLNGHESTNIDVIDEALDQAEQVLERMKAERARIAGRKQ